MAGRKAKNRKPRRLTFKRAASGAWVWRADRPYKKVRIEIFKTCEYVKYSSTRIVPGSIRYYACLHRVGAPHLGPESSHPAVFVNCADYGQEFQRRAVAQRTAIEWINAGWPRATVASLAKWNATHGDRHASHGERAR